MMWTNSPPIATPAKAICRTQENAEWLVTGGNRSRDVASVMIQNAKLFGTLGSLSHTLDAGGPLDAPDFMAGGSTNCTEWTTGAGSPVVSQLMIHRKDLM